MNLLCAKQRIYMCCCVLLTVIWKTKADYNNDEFDETHVRTWTGWYNTDNPAVGVGDDESVASIRKRGYEICQGHSPIDAACRDANDHLNVFNLETKKFTGDTLVIPCNTQGLVCRNVDQWNTTCRDYEIRFECLGPSEVTPPENLGVIGVAAGLSVIVPILCVGIMHIVRLFRDRRRLGRQSLVQNSEQSVQTENSDLPPSYSCLFGEEDGISNNRSSSLGISLTGSSGDLRLPSSRLSSSSLQSITENQTSVSIPTQGTDNLHNTQSPNDNQQRTSWRSRFPNMHLSVFDLFTSSGSRSPPQSPDLSYLQTPPPTYKDAIVILGGQAYSVSENGDLDEKTNL